MPARMLRATRYASVCCVDYAIDVMYCYACRKILMLQPPCRFYATLAQRRFMILLWRHAAAAYADAVAAEIFSRRHDAT